jgi:hypothetical protein
VDPELLRFLARFPREQQASLLQLLKGLDQREQAKPAAGRARTSNGGRKRARVPAR